jgi:hypothetical protein
MKSILIVLAFGLNGEPPRMSTVRFDTPQACTKAAQWLSSLGPPRIETACVSEP